MPAGVMEAAITSVEDIRAFLAGDFRNSLRLGEEMIKEVRINHGREMQELVDGRLEKHGWLETFQVYAAVMRAQLELVAEFLVDLTQGKLSSVTFDVDTPIIYMCRFFTDTIFRLVMNVRSFYSGTLTMDSEWYRPHLVGVVETSLGFSAARTIRSESHVIVLE